MTIPINQTADFYKALGDPTRLKILNLLLSYNNTLCVGMLAQKLEITQSAVSQHLKILKHNGIVESKRMGFQVHYQVKNDIFEQFGIKLESILTKVDQNCELVNECSQSTQK